MVFTMDEEPLEVGVWVEEERQVISMDEKKLRELLERATSDSEQPAPPSVMEQLSKEARSATPETALRMARWLEHRLRSTTIPVGLSSARSTWSLTLSVSVSVSVSISISVCLCLRLCAHTATLLHGAGAA